MQTAQFVSEVPAGFDFVSDSQHVEALREYFVDAREYDSFFVRIEGCAYVAGYGMHGVIPHNSNRVFSVQTRESLEPRTMADLNDVRVTRATRALAAYARAHGGAYMHEPCDAQLSDLLADLRHFAQARGLDFSHLDARAFSNYCEEDGSNSETRASEMRNEPSI